MENRGVILAIESNYSRALSLIHNNHRMGVMNTAVIRMSAEEFPELNIKVDRILLDAPCSCEGVMHRDTSRKSNLSSEDIRTCSAIQRKLLKAAMKCLKKGGIVVYSTCSLTPEENEMVIQEVLDSYSVRLEEIEWGDEAFTEIPNTGYQVQRGDEKSKKILPS